VTTPTPRPLHPTCATRWMSSSLRSGPPPGRPWHCPRHFSFQQSTSRPHGPVPSRRPPREGDTAACGSRMHSGLRSRSNEITVEGSTSHQTIGPYPLQRMARPASRPDTTGPNGNIVPDEFGQLRSISVAADPEGSQTHRRRRRTRPRCDSRPASGWYHLDVPRRSGDLG
jgi:hypothetical protein